MKRIKSYTLGWDTEHKQGYINLVDEDDQKQMLSKIPTQEFSMMLMLLARGDVFIDDQKWIISGWNPEN
jgi:hypothetical protein